MRFRTLHVITLIVSACAGCAETKKEESCATENLMCNGHGTCSDASGTPVCVCNVEYSGASCGACSPGYQDKDADGTCTATCATVGEICNGHGSCDDSSGVTICVCDPGHTGSACETCGVTGAGAVYLYDVGATLVTDMGGSRAAIDARAQAALRANLSGVGTGTTYEAHGFISMTGDAIRDFPANFCVPNNVPVYGVNGGGTQTLLANNWADFMDGIIATTIGVALGYQDFEYFWTGSNEDGSASGNDCSSWSTTAGSDASISRRSNATTDWLQEAGNFLASCGSGYKMLGLAYCVADCP